jgi:hypothetical protein
MFSVIGFSVLAAVMLGCMLFLWKRPGEGIGLPLVAILCFAYLYLLLPLQLIWSGTMEAYLDDWQVGKAVVAAAVMLACFVWGWRKGTSRIRRTPAAPTSWNPVRVWNYGFAGATVGFALLTAFVLFNGGLSHAFGGMHGKGMEYDSTTAYWYLSPYWMVSGLGMMVIGDRRQRPWRRMGTVAFVVILYAYSLLTSSRGFTFATTAVILVGYALARRTKPTIVQMVPFWAAAGVAVLLVLGYRQVLHLGEDRRGAGGTPTLIEALSKHWETDDRSASRRIASSEFIFHAATLDTVDELKKYDLAVHWFYICTLHLIPRVWWPAKPKKFDSPGITNDDISAVTGIRIAFGSAPGVVADIYTNFGPVSPLFFFLFGMAAGKLYEGAQFRGDPSIACAYAMLCALSLNAFAQGFSTLLVFFPYSLAPAFFYHLHTRLLSPRKRRLTLGKGPRFTWRDGQPEGSAVMARQKV